MVDFPCAPLGDLARQVFLGGAGVSSGVEGFVLHISSISGWVQGCRRFSLCVTYGGRVGVHNEWING